MIARRMSILAKNSPVKAKYVCALKHTEETSAIQDLLGDE